MTKKKRPETVSELIAMLKEETKSMYRLWLFLTVCFVLFCEVGRRIGDAYFKELLIWMGNYSEYGALIIGMIVVTNITTNRMLLYHELKRKRK